MKQKSRWLKLFNVQYQLQNGKNGVWTFASRKASPNPGQPLVADAVVIIPIHADRLGLVTIKEFRIPLGDYEHGFPAGLYDHNESAEDVAYRELEEETGLIITDILYVSPPAVSSAGLSDESVIYVVCICAGEPHTDGNEGTEDIEVNILDKNQIKNLLLSGEKISAKALPFLLMLSNQDPIDWPDIFKISN